MEKKYLLLGLLTVGTRITIPMPIDDDTWESAMISDVDDIDDDDMVYFLDDDYNEHKIEVSRVQLYTA